MPLDADAIAKKAASDVFGERVRQRAQEGWTIEHDDEHHDGAMARAAAAYAYASTLLAEEQQAHARSLWGEVTGFSSVLAQIWPSGWSAHWFKPKDRRRDLVRSGALILAEIERIDRDAYRRTNWAADAIDGQQSSVPTVSGDSDGR